MVSGMGQSEHFQNGVRRFALGLYENAHQLFVQALTDDPEDAEARYFLHLCRRCLAPKPINRPTLVWQFDPKGAWEADWLRTLLGDAIGSEVIDNTWTGIADPMIVVDNRLVTEKALYYRDAFARGARIILVHLSDEAFRDDRGLYRYCDAVIRNYHTPLIQDRRVLTIPLGCKAGFVRTSAAPKPAAARAHLWSFAGDFKKLTRTSMRTAMEAVGPGRCHAIEGFGTPDSLSTADYRALLDDSVIVPCPAGWSNLETFRVYEALEAGCIPIVEKRPGFDYFTELLGPHPIPTIFSWDEAPALIRGWQAEGTMERVRSDCHAWWEAAKPRIAATVQDTIKKVLS